MPEREYRFAVVGAGNIARIHAAALADIPNARLVAVCDMDPALLEQLAEVGWASK